MLSLRWSNDVDPPLVAAYDAEAERVGNPTGLVLAPPPGSPTSVFVSRDPNAAWARLGPYLLHDARAYAAWMDAAGTDSASRSDAGTVEELRAEAGPYRIVEPATASELLRADGLLSTQPLCGGIPPDRAWPSLHLIGAEVLP